MKVPPHSIEAEQAVLGGILIDPEAYARVSWLVPQDFYRHDHQQIFRAIESLPDGTPADIVTVTSQIDDLEEVGGQGYIAHLANVTPTTANIIHYAKTVRERAALRAVIGVASEISDSAFEAETASEVIDDAEKRILEVGRGVQGDDEGYADFRASLRETLDNLDATYQARIRGETTGIMTGVDSFDRRFGGLHAGDLIIIAGRPSMGKSALAQTWMRSIAEQEKSVAIHSVEMPHEQLNHRWLSQYSGVPVDRFRNANFADDDWPKVTNAMGRLSQLQGYLHVHDRSNITPAKVTRLARRLKAETGLSMLVIDYLQILDSDQTNNERRHQIDEMTRAFKNLAIELSIPVVLISQLSRAVEQRQDKRPMLSDLRESGGIEQDADMVLFPYRPAYYGEDAAPGLAELHVAKQRQGPTGYIECAFVEERAMFTDLETRY